MMLIISDYLITIKLISPSDICKHILTVFVTHRECSRRVIQQTTRN